MNIKTNVLEVYINFLDTTKKQSKYFNMILSLVVIVITLFLFFLLFKYKNE